MAATERDKNETAASFSDLANSTSYRFSEWPNPKVPTFGAGVYTIWHRDGRFIYVGMSGRGMTAGTVYRDKPLGIYTRLKSHASGRRSGDQFCVYPWSQKRSSPSFNCPCSRPLLASAVWIKMITFISHPGFISEQSLRKAHRDKGLKIFCRKLASACRPTNMLWVPGRTV